MTSTPASASVDTPEDHARHRQHVGSISRAAANYKRRKTTNACQVCRARRTKCDNARPCSYCAKNGHECTSSPSDAPQWDPATLQILSRIDSLENQIAGVSRGVAAGLRAESDAGTPASSRTAARQNTSAPDRVFPQSLETVLKWTPLSQLDDFCEIAQQSGHAKYMHKAADLPTQSHSPDLEYPTCRRRLESFFAHVHPKNPILNKSEIDKALKQACFDGFLWDADHALLLLLLALGALAMPFVDGRQQTSRPDMEAANALYTGSQKRFGSHINSPYLAQAKYLFYSGVYLMSVLRPFDAWRTFLQALAVCQGFRSLSLSQSGESDRRDIDEESLYWSCWKSEREVRSELGLPDFGTNGLEHPHTYPSLPHGCEGETLRAWYFYLAEISLWRLETSAKKEIAEVVAGGSDADLEKLAVVVNQLREPLQSWESSLPATLGFDNATDHETCVLRFVLRGRFTYNNELLTWPFLYNAVHSSHRIAPQALQLAIDALDYHHERLVTNRSGFFHRHHGTWLMMRSSARSACILLAAALTRTTAVHLPHAWVENVWNTVEMLEYWNQQGGGLDSVAAFLRHTVEKLTVS